MHGIDLRIRLEYLLIGGRVGLVNGVFFNRSRVSIGDTVG